MNSTLTRKQLIFVLGMHRSGTSAITKGLETLGVTLGDRLLPAVAGDNDKGYFEDIDFNNLNIDLLTTAGATWESLRPLSAHDFANTRFDALRMRAVTLINEKLVNGLCCVKDPRFSALLPFWLKVLDVVGVEPLFVMAVRNPQSVVRSLQTGLRGEIPDALGYYLWLVSNTEALYYMAPHKSVVVAFDAMLESPDHELNRIADALAIPQPAGNAEASGYKEFLDPSLIRNRATPFDLASDPVVPAEVTELYGLLLGLAADKLTLQDRVTFARIEALHEGLLGNARFYQYADCLKQRVNALIAQDKVCQNQIGSLQNDLMRSEKRYSDLETRHVELLQKLSAQEEALGTYHETLTNVFASRSWRITAPLRLVMHKARRAYQLSRLTYQMSDHVITRRNFARFLSLIRYHGPLQAMRIVSQELDRLCNLENNPFAVTSSKVVDYLPDVENAPEPNYTGTVDVIIPVYKGLDFTRKCVESVLAAKTAVQHRVIVINDCSPEAEVKAYIDSLQAHPGLMVLENPENLGFVKTVNAGMRLSQTHDVLLLNSDTEVCDYWLERIVAHTLINESVATITPFSNNATICSFPTIYGKRVLPAGVSLAAMNEAFYAANRHGSISVPSGVGFCMFIARACLKEIGLFDEEAFGKGYGEENDFCMRAQAQGWKNLLACDVFVFHAGEVSFQDSSTPGKQNALRIINQRYPNYETLIRNHVSLAEAERFRIRAAASIFKASGKTTWLMVNHALGGGTQKHLHELINVVGSEINVISINPVLTREHLVQVHLLIQDEKLTYSFDSRFDSARFIDFLASCGCSRIHYHHIIGFLPELLERLRNYAVPFDFTVHDYYTICPNINLIKGDTYCGELGIAQCNVCISESHQSRATEILAWRNRHSWLITDAQRVICPSNDTLQRMRRYYPTGNFVKRYHQDVQLPHTPRDRVMRNKGAIRVAILGSLSIAKGANLVRDLLSLIQIESVNVSIRVIGSSQGLIRPRFNYSESGAYKESQLDEFLEAANADVILFPGRIPETYSYTLSEAIRSGLPILAPDVGAFPERLAHYPLGRIYNHLTDAREVLTHILNLYDTELALESSQISPPKTRSVASFYKHFYLKADSKSGVVDLRTGTGRAAVIIAESIGNNTYSPCAYIRLILPLMSNEFGIYETVKVVDASEALNYIGDDFYAHRISVGETHVQELLEHCSSQGIRLIYDIDDDLLGIAKSDHPERKFYESYADVITRLVKNAEEVFVSTPSLAKTIGELRKTVSVRPNKLSREIIPLTWQRSPQKPIGILYMGTLTHGADFQLVEEALTQIKDTYGAAVSLYLIGVTTQAVNSKYFTVLTPPAEFAGSYPLFMQWLGGLNMFDIGIAPLEDNAFNLHKSDIKFLDYSALKIATVASYVEAYANTIVDHETGLLVDNKSAAWFDALSELISSKEMRTQLADNAFAYLQTHRSY
jgi:GT2 family glycosyltransferase/glycosyltransferase involved in cell wall biosynthesis